jgi:hypothetical protein
MLDELHRPLVTHVVEEATNVRIEYPVHSFSLDAHGQGVTFAPFRTVEGLRWPGMVKFINDYNKMS